MKPDEITERLEKIRADIGSGFEKELLDFDEIENELSIVIDALKEKDVDSSRKSRRVVRVENYI